MNAKNVTLAVLLFSSLSLGTFAMANELKQVNGDNTVYCQRHEQCINDCDQFRRPRFKGGPRGFANSQYKTIEEIKKSAKDDDIVIVSGALTDYIKGDKYTFTDDKDQSITVELDDKRDWSYLEKGEKIDLLAKVDKDHDGIVLKVKAARPNINMLKKPRALNK